MLQTHKRTNIHTHAYTNIHIHTQTHAHIPVGLWLPSWEGNSDTSSILVKADHITQNTNIFWFVSNDSISSYRQIVEQNGLYRLGEATSLGEEQIFIKTS